MPVISRFQGVVIKMYFRGREHNPPHFHAFHGSDAAALSIEDGAVIDGSLPPAILGRVRQWFLRNRGELREMWDTQQFRKLK